MVLWLEELAFLQFKFKLRGYLKTHNYEEHKFTKLDYPTFMLSIKSHDTPFEEVNQVH